MRTSSQTSIKMYLFVAFIILSLTLSACAPDTTTPTTETLLPAKHTATPGAGGSPGTPGGLPNMPNKPQPQGSTFQGCPPGGDGGDTIQDTLKNRIDQGSYVPVTFDSIFSLTWPKDVEKKERKDWSSQDTAAIHQWEGIPVSVIGYLYGAKESGSESTNCHGTTPDMVDWHIWLTKTAGEDRTHSIVIETTPRIRANHKWALSMLESLAKSQTPVRISGWLFFDPEHPDQILKTRGTIWEIHPIMQIEFQQNGKWVPLDNMAP